MEALAEKKAALKKEGIALFQKTEWVRNDYRRSGEIALELARLEKEKLGLKCFDRERK